MLAINCTLFGKYKPNEIYERIDKDIVDDRKDSISIRFLLVILSCLIFHLRGMQKIIFLNSLFTILCNYFLNMTKIVITFFICVRCCIPYTKFLKKNLKLQSWLL